jgi:DNA-directed RNA polymerase subunit K/omega
LDGLDRASYTLNHSHEVTMVKRPDGMNAFEFSVLSALRAAQLHRGCTPRVVQSEKIAVTAQHEVAERKVVRSPNIGELVAEPIK